MLTLLILEILQLQSLDKKEEEQLKKESWESGYTSVVPNWSCRKKLKWSSLYSSIKANAHEVGFGFKVLGPKGPFEALVSTIAARWLFKKILKDPKY